MTEGSHMTWEKFLFVTLGGGLGSLCRYSLSEALRLWLGHPFPWGTFTVNLAGCFAIGLLSGLGDHRPAFSPEARALLIAGFLGGFTTFSSFAYETVHLSRTGEVPMAVANVLLQVLLGLLAAWGGRLLAEGLWPLHP